MEDLPVGAEVTLKVVETKEADSPSPSFYVTKTAFSFTSMIVLELKSKIQTSWKSR